MQEGMAGERHRSEFPFSLSLHVPKKSNCFVLNRQRCFFLWPHSRLHYNLTPCYKHKLVTPNSTAINLVSLTSLSSFLQTRPIQPHSHSSPMNPSPINSPPSRIGPSVSSPSLIVNNEQPTLASSKRRTPKPFLLRSTTPLNVPDKQKKDEGKNEGKELAVKMVRSKTDSSLGIHSTAKSPPPPTLPPPSTSSNPRRSSRPLSTSTNRDTLPIRASRKITFVPDSKPPPPSKAANPRPSSSSSAARAQAVEKQKMDLKRESLLSRRTNCVGNEDSENVNPAGLPQSKRRWSLRPLQDPPRPPRSIAHSSLASLTSPDSPSPQNRRPRSPSPAAPSNLSRTSTSNLRDRLTTSLTAVKLIEEPRTESLRFDSPIYSRPPLRGPSSSASTPASTTSRQLQKRASYAGLSRVPPAEVSRLESSGEMEESNSGIDCAGQTGAGEATVSGNSGYKSLHEVSLHFLAHT